jgi:hypothetical protein
MPAIRVVTQKLTRIVQLKCLRLVFAGDFVVEVVIPDTFSKAIVPGDKTTEAMRTAVMQDFKKLLALAETAQNKVEEAVRKNQDSDQRKKMADGLSTLLRHLLELYKDGAPASAKTVWDAYVDKNPQYKDCSIRINANLTGVRVAVTANNLGLR